MPNFGLRGGRGCRQCREMRARGLLLSGILILGAQAARAESDSRDPLVPVARVAPRVVIDLRYATAENPLGRPLYPPGTRTLLRRSTARRLAEAARFAEEFGHRLVLLDGWRSPEASTLMPPRCVASQQNRHGAVTNRPAVH